MVTDRDFKSWVTLLRKSYPKPPARILSQTGKKLSLMNIEKMFKL